MALLLGLLAEQQTVLTAQVQVAALDIPQMDIQVLVEVVALAWLRFAISLHLFLHTQNLQTPISMLE
jgi:hypothetical protein